MADAALSFALEQLSTVLREESALLGGLQDEVQHIKDELGQMKGFLRRAEVIVENDPSLKEWVSQVRDVAYDVEDVLDEFILRFQCHYGDGFCDRVRKVFSSIRNLRARHQLATKIRALKERIKHISDTHQRYQNHYGSSSSVVDQNQNKKTWHDSRGDALLLEEEDLVGIERPKKKLTEMLFTDDPQLRVISAVGMGGLGKTTLVKKVYDDAAVKNRFNCHLWITVSQSFKIEELLANAIRQLCKELQKDAPDDLNTMDTNRMKLCVRDLLRQEKFILVFDDVWKTTDWDALRVAFPRNNNCGSVIIITTRITKLGQTAISGTLGNIYELEPLTKEESWNLFCKKAFRATSCPPQLEEMSGHIIERCKGLPLAIVVIGGVLATKNQRVEEWVLFDQSLGEQLANDDQLINMMKLLSLSYYDLPNHLRICFLYFSILPEDFSINKNRLLRLWIAEGFVQKGEGTTTEEVAEYYLNELISRSLVQIARRAPHGRMKACGVHDIILQFILHKAREQYITNILCEQIIQPPNKVRRLVIHNSMGNIQVSNGLIKCIRSLVSFDSMSKPLLSKLLSDSLGVLKVLDLEGATFEEIPNEVFKFLHLKYLSLRYTRVGVISKLIGKLQKLETLELRNIRVRQLPAEILKLQRLQHLLMGDYGEGIQLPGKIGNLQSLQSLVEVDAYQKGDMMSTVKEMGKLTQLRNLGISNLRRGDGEELCSSIEKLTNLRTLGLYFKEGEVMDLEYPVSSTPKFLGSLKLVGKLEKLPQWIASLHGLTELILIGIVLRDDPLPLLEYLPNLVYLYLRKAYRGEGLCFKARKFHRLKTLGIGGMEELRWVRVDKGSMPFLEKLYMRSCESVEELPQGIQHLTSLQEFHVEEMSDKFVKVIEDTKVKENVNSENFIAHIPRVIISGYGVNGRFYTRAL